MESNYLIYLAESAVLTVILGFFAILFAIKEIIEIILPFRF